VTPDEAIETVARHVIAVAAREVAEDGWCNYPDIGEADWNAVDQRVTELASFPADETYNEAYVLLQERADDYGGAA
jgi:hypothetical protein